MKVTNRNAREEKPFGDITVSEGFIYNDLACMKIKLPDGIPAAVVMQTGESFCLSSTTFVYPIKLEAIYS